MQIVRLIILPVLFLSTLARSAPATRPAARPTATA